jgi:hypothetical protein
MAKRVDFSLGMRDISSGEQLSDVYESRDPSQYREVIQEAIRLDDERRTSESLDRQGAARTSSRDGRTMTGILRRSTTQSFGGGGSKNRRGSGTGPHRVSISSTDTHRNRFLSRLNRHGRSIDMPRDSLAEEGQAPPLPQIDSRSGLVGSQAVRNDSNTSAGENLPFPALTHSNSRIEDFALNGSHEAAGPSGTRHAH